MKQFLHVALMALMTVALAACSTSKKITANEDAGLTGSAPFVPDTYLATIRANECDATHLTAKLHLRIQMGEQSVSSTGTLRMKKDDVIQLSVLDPILHVAEIGRMEFTRTHVLIIDRFNKQFIDVPYDEVDFLKRANVDFNTLQALFWNEVFLPGEDEPAAGAYTYLTPEGHTPQASSPQVDLTYMDRLLQYRFHTQQPDGTLLSTDISSAHGGDSQFSFDYADFQRFKGKTFPADMTMSFTMGSQSASLNINLSSLRDNADWSARSYAPASYTQVDAEKILRALVQ